MTPPKPLIDRPHQQPLWRQLEAAAEVLRGVASGRSATAAWADTPVDLRPAAQALSSHALRHWGEAQALCSLLATRAPPPAAHALLCLTLALLLGDDDAESPEASNRPHYAEHTLVNQAVEAARRGADTSAQAAFLNACLRRALREWPALRARAVLDPVARWNHPRWWVKQLQNDHPQHWQTILEAARCPPPMTLRVSSRWGTPADYIERLRLAGMQATSTGPQAVRLAQPCGVQQLPGFAEGQVSVQDAHAQLAARLLLGLDEPRAPDARAWRVLDACAAPGGKTLHLLELADVRLLALDMDAERTRRVHENLKRSGRSAQVVVADAAQPQTWWDGEAFDAVLLDAPCTASGIERRHPDVRWLRRPQDLVQLAAQQARLLDALWPLVKPGGRLLYCTCSVFRVEGSQQIKTFLARNTNAQCRPSPGHLLPGRAGPSEGLADNASRDGDGFFYALLQKTQV